jgi:four helix bundle protein
MHDYKKLNVWDRSYKFVLKVYQVTKTFPKEERFALVDQLRRSVISIPANIAEGGGKNGNKEFYRYLSISFGSANESEVYFNLAKDLGYIDEKTYEDLVNELTQIKKMLFQLMKTVSS